MDIQASSKDRIALMRSSWQKDSPHTTDNFETSASIDKSTSDNSSTPKRRIYDTVHYLSPATTPADTEYEGDLFYQHFVRVHTRFEQPGAFDYASSSSTTVSCDEPDLQRTLAIIKPDALQYKDVVLRAINEAGLKILSQRLLHLSPEQVSDIYAKFYGSSSFPNLVVSMSVSPLIVLSLAGKNAVQKWKTMVGPYGLLREEWFFPYSVRTRFGIQPDMSDAIHASDNITEAKWENRYFFPRSILEPLPVDEERVTDYVSNLITPTLMEGLIQVVRTKPIDPILFLAEWLLLNNPYQPRFPERIAVSPL
ncbi:hypothetical protein JTB14_026509 [Gonioctena quinquepunctata]|nr:hypothetical protein JTB14_026509 [Gonioctena quinquepunctata]